MGIGVSASLGGRRGGGVEGRKGYKRCLDCWLADGLTLLASRRLATRLDSVTRQAKARDPARWMWRAQLATGAHAVESNEARGER